VCLAHFEHGFSNGGSVQMPALGNAHSRLGFRSFDGLHGGVVEEVCPALPALETRQPRKRKTVGESYGLRDPNHGQSAAFRAWQGKIATTRATRRASASMR